MWRLFNGFWKDDLMTPRELLFLWFNFLEVAEAISGFKRNDNKMFLEIIQKIVLWIVFFMWMLFQVVQFLVQYSLLPFLIFSEWFCNLFRD